MNQLSSDTADLINKFNNLNLSNSFDIDIPKETHTLLACLAHIPQQESDIMISRYQNESILTLSTTNNASMVWIVIQQSRYQVDEQILCINMQELLDVSNTNLGLSTIRFLWTEVQDKFEVTVLSLSQPPRKLQGYKISPLITNHPCNTWDFVQGCDLLYALTHIMDIYQQRNTEYLVEIISNLDSLTIKFANWQWDIKTNYIKDARETGSYSILINAEHLKSVYVYLKACSNLLYQITRGSTAPHDWICIQSNISFVTYKFYIAGIQ